MNLIPELAETTPEEFCQNIVTARAPVVLREFVKHWQLVSLRDSADDFSRRLQQEDSGEKFYTVVGSPDIKGRFFYGDGLQGTNFNKTNATISDALAHIAQQSSAASPHAIAVQAARVATALPNIAKSHTNPLLPNIDPTLWLSNQSMVAAHFDLHDNIACVVHGRRRFTLFPPEQIANLYIGPTLNAPGGVPISIVDLNKPDLEKYPRFQDALDAALYADLEPGDAIFIPTPWWHAVESKDPLNMLINYWWSAQVQPLVAANKSLMHSMLSIGNLPIEQRRAWKDFFDYLVFRQELDPTEHLPAELHDVVTSLSPEQEQQVMDYLSTKTSSPKISDPQ